MSWRTPGQQRHTLRFSRLKLRQGVGRQRRTQASLHTTREASHRPRTVRMTRAYVTGTAELLDPAYLIASKIRRALDPTQPASRSPVIIYDGQGRAVATIDPWTRVRTPIA